MSTARHSIIRVDGRAYRAVLEEGPRNWSAHVPALPGLVVTAANRVELRDRLREAIAFHLEGLERQSASAPAYRAVG